MAALEKIYILYLLEQNHWNISKAAKIAGLKNALRSTPKCARWGFSNNHTGKGATHATEDRF